MPEDTSAETLCYNKEEDKSPKINTHNVTLFYIFSITSIITILIHQINSYNVKIFPSSEKRNVLYILYKL